MIILLVSPCINPDYKTPKKAMIPQLSLHILSSLTPSTHRVIIVEEEYEKIPFDAECDLVGISCFTANAPRAYEIAGEFRRRGKAVVLGGIHPTLLPDEALRHADAVIAGEAELLVKEDEVLNVLRVLDALYQSGREGREITVL